MRRTTMLWVVACLLAMTSTLQAGPFSSMVGDNDGYGLGIADNGAAPWSSPTQDWRSPAEQAATNGAQFTDCYSALFPGYSPNPSESGNVVFALPEDLTSATLTIDMGDFQAWAGQVVVTFNGLLQPNLLNYDDGYKATRVRQFAVSADALALANAADQFIVGLDHTGSGDFIAFDYFQLDGVTAGPAIPAPGALLLAGIGTGLLRCLRRREVL